MYYRKIDCPSFFPIRPAALPLSRRGELPHAVKATDKKGATINLSSASSSRKRSLARNTCMSAEVETGGEAGWLKKKGTKRTAAERQERERERERERKRKYSRGWEARRVAESVRVGSHRRRLPQLRLASRYVTCKFALRRGSPFFILHARVLSPNPPIFFSYSSPPGVLLPVADELANALRDAPVSRRSEA